MLQMFIPMHQGGNHWCLIVIEVKHKAIQYYDSLGGKDEGALELMVSLIHVWAK